ncbi:TetR/AcrR family transcriptional regulator [Paeniglutamicibacter sp. Y32M11]|uniref:TetR/AcrR family transcriptional regulator n=1 Tax=Paeniglutamicibacter sp. Y32M11 TaxID=2853258 RepID=UPI001C52955A|nr:TetR/AcrR family transcriptional regulator [Paeniglutamicibacter sp. Y32M11]QXQ10338.1 TetR/AcrR family transcriptional regulator [Paeniglutamicibacter sp. Y32M11]
MKSGGLISSLLAKTVTNPASSGRRAAQMDMSATVPEEALAMDRDEILRGCAHELFSIKGLGVPLSEIARIAGVGVATLYRRYRDKDVLILDVYRRHILDRGDFAVAANSYTHPWEGIEHFLRVTSAQLAADRGMRELILGGYVGSAGWARGSTPEELLAALSEMEIKLTEQLELLVERALAVGVVRDDFRHTDLLLMMAMVHSAVPVDAPDRAELSHRALQLLIEGMRPAA